MSTFPTPTAPAQIFFSYSHKDEELRDKLAGHLSGPKRAGLIGEWHDRRIVPGDDWAGQIDQHLQTADIILLLVSADFIASPYCYDVELRQAMQRHEAGDACVIPVILRPVVWRHMPFARLQALPKNAEPVTSWEDVDKALVNVTEGVIMAVEHLRSGGAPPPAAVQAPRPLPRVPKPPCPAHVEQGASARRGIKALVDLIRGDPAARVEAVKFHSEFQRLRQQLKKLGDHKDLHDLLHELHIHSYKAIVDEADRFPDEKSREVLSEYEIRLAQLVDRLDQVTARDSFVPEHVAWIGKLHEAREALCDAVEGPEPEKLKLALRLMKGVLSTQPSKIATRLNSVAEDLHLESLAGAMTAILDRLSPLDSDMERIKEFADGTDDLNKLNARLTPLVVDHFLWQEVDDLLALVERSLHDDLDPLVETWPDIREKMQSLYGPAGEQESEQFRAEGEKLDRAIRENNPFRMRHSFRRYRAHATMRFYEVDKKLRSLCGSLASAAEPLDQLLHILGDRA